MSRNASKLAPIAFWVGFLALGFLTNIGHPGKSRQVKEALLSGNEARHNLEVGAASTAFIDPPAEGGQTKRQWRPFR
jgi:hypothetical protein